MVVMQAPERTVQQRMEALGRANEVRKWRAERKRELRAGRGSVVDLLLSEDERVQTWQVLDLLLAVPKVGRVKASKILNRNAISPSKTIGGMTDRQRSMLLAALLSGGGGTVRR